MKKSWYDYERKRTPGSFICFSCYSSYLDQYKFKKSTPFQIPFFILMFLSVFVASQNIIIGHLKHGDFPVSQVSIEIIPQQGSPAKEFTGNSSDFQLTLPFQNVYTIRFHHPAYFLSYITVDTRVPQDKMSYRMVTEFEMLLYDKNDKDVNPGVFKEPLQRFFFNGTNKIVNDTLWLKYIYGKLLKSPQETVIHYDASGTKIPENICARFFLENQNSLPITLQEIQLMDNQNRIIKKTRTNRFGELTITGVHTDNLSEIRLTVKKELTASKRITLRNIDSTFLKTASSDASGVYSWKLSPTEWKKLLCQNPEYYLGGKIISTTPKEKSFFANQKVYLCNQFNTVIKTTRTNQLGMFAFEDIKPDQTYFIGVDTGSITKNQRLDLLNKNDQLAGRIDSLSGKRYVMRIRTDGNDLHQMLLLSEKDLRMDVNARIYEKNPGQPLDAKVTILNEKYTPIDSVRARNVGEFTFKYLPYIKRFFMEIEPENDVMLDQISQLLFYGKEGEFIKAFTNLKGKKFVYKPILPEISKMRDVTMEDPWLELSIGRKNTSRTPPVISEKILFDFNQYTLQEISKDILDKIAVVLKENRNYHLIISAFTDCIGSSNDNLELSRKRAESVRQYLVQKGIDPLRLQARGFGEEKPLNHCVDGVNCSELEHAINRRVEFTILIK